MNQYLYPIISIFEPFIENSIILFLVYVASSFLCAIIIDKFFILIAKNLVKKTKTTIDDKLIDVIHPAIYKTILFLGLRPRFFFSIFYIIILLFL